MSGPLFHAAFYGASAVAVLASAAAVSRRHPVHALLYFVVSLLALALVFLLLGAPFVAALEVIVYAGAIMVLFVFVVMLLDLRPGREGEGVASGELRLPRTWAGPGLLAALLAAELAVVLIGGAPAPAGGAEVAPREVGRLLFGPWLLAAELAAMMLLAALVAAFHLGRDSSGVEGGR